MIFRGKVVLSLMKVIVCRALEITSFHIDFDDVSGVVALERFAQRSCNKKSAECHEILRDKSMHRHKTLQETIAKHFRCNSVLACDHSELHVMKSPREIKGGSEYDAYHYSLTLLTLMHTMLRMGYYHTEDNLFDVLDIGLGVLESHRWMEESRSESQGAAETTVPITKETLHRANAEAKKSSTSNLMRLLHRKKKQESESESSSEDEDVATGDNFWNRVWSAGKSYVLGQKSVTSSVGDRSEAKEAIEEKEQALMHIASSDEVPLGGDSMPKSSLSIYTRVRASDSKESEEHLSMNTKYFDDRQAQAPSRRLSVDDIKRSHRGKDLCAMCDRHDEAMPPETLTEHVYENQRSEFRTYNNIICIDGLVFHGLQKQAFQLVDRILVLMILFALCLIMSTHLLIRTTVEVFLLVICGCGREIGSSIRMRIQEL